MIRIQKWPTESIQPLNDLYMDVDQTYCLVQLSTPLPTNEAYHYLNAIREGIVNEKPFLCFGIYMDQELIGKVEVSRYPNNEAELDIVLKKQCTNKGYGSEALSLLIEHLKELNWCKSIHAYVNEENGFVRRILEKNSFQPSRKFKTDIATFHDGIYTMKEITGIEYIYSFE